MGADRSHLSIGEVLSLLQPEFPDITISKIRFLESQGLLDPERTPSGYRKFHDADIERLRWILTQQRDHFLPLKVIKDRLASGDLGNDTPEGVLPLAADATDAASAAPDEPADPPARTDSGEAGADAPEPGTAPTRAPLTLLKRAGVVVDDEPADVHPAGRPAVAEVAGDPPDGPPGDVDPDHDRAKVVARLVEGPAETNQGSGGPDGQSRGRRRHPTGHTPGQQVPPPEPADDLAPIRLEGESGAVTLSLDELSAATGLTTREIGELERYGLLGARSMGSVDYYDEDALVVARLAVGFARYGIEPRHLRMYKVAAEREAGLFEQLITPLLKQRRPSARQEAVEVLEDLAELADDLRAAMVRAALRDYLGRA
jgi:DNA-binding transcriptional MerR regulator